MAVQRILTNICADDLAASRNFYVNLLGLKATYDSDWYVQLKSTNNDLLELGIILRSHDLVPPAFQAAPTGMYITFVVPDVDAIYKHALQLNLPIVQEPRNEFYCQRRFLLTDPAGCLVDICSPWSEEEK